MPNRDNKSRSATGFRLDPETLTIFRERLRERGMAMQPTLEAWVKRWIETGEPFLEGILAEVREGQNELRTLVANLASDDPETPPSGSTGNDSDA